MTMSSALIYASERHIDAINSASTLYGIDANTGEILLREEFESSAFGNADRTYWERTFYVMLRARGYSVLN